MLQSNQKKEIVEYDNVDSMMVFLASPTNSEYLDGNQDTFREKY